MRSSNSPEIIPFKKVILRGARLWWKYINCVPGAQQDSIAAVGMMPDRKTGPSKLPAIVPSLRLRLVRIAEAEAGGKYTVFEPGR